MLGKHIKPMEQALKSTIKFCRVNGILLDLSEYDREDLILAIEMIWLERQTNTGNDPPLIIRLPGIERPVTIHECDFNRVEREQ